MQPTNGFEWFIAAIKRYAEFQGRSRRREFWYFVLFNVLTDFVAGFLDGLFGVGLFYPIASLALLLPNIAVGVRRLHDTNRSGWWCLLPIVNIVFWAEDSDPSQNRFGPCPKSPAEMRGGAPRRSPIGLDNLDQLEKLAALRDKGVLTDEEFQTKKAALL